MTCPRCEGTVLEVKDLWFSYGKRPVLEGVSLQVPAGSFAALIGPNGAGKSTLLRILLGILKPHQGTVTLFDRPPGQHGQPIGYVPQGIHLPRGFPLSVLDVVLMGRFGNLGPVRRPNREDRQRVHEALEQVGMDHLATRRFEDLSGGQRQRVLIARALVSEPCLLILDEPTSGLDPAARQRFYDQVCDLQRARGLTLFCASHDVEDVARHAQMLILLDHTVRAVGPPQEVMKSQAVPQVYHFPPPHVHKDDKDEAPPVVAGLEATVPDLEGGTPNDGAPSRGPLP
jgi:ABC-type Mn2+/Zn2+ transport system ATPase subunit